MKKVAQELQETVAYVMPFLNAISPSEAAEKPLVNKWSKKEILGHLIDSAGNNQQKFVRMMAQPHIDFEGYAQVHWVQSQHYQTAEWADLIGLWGAFNGHLAHIITYTDATHLQNTIMIDGEGPFTLEFLMMDYVAHVKHHLKQILPSLSLENSFLNVYNNA